MKKITAFLMICIVLIILMYTKEKTFSSEYISKNSISSFLRGYGWETDEDLICTEKITIPEKFSTAYSEYNKIQQQQGFDLLGYRGCPAVLYTCPVLNYSDGLSVSAQLIVYENRLIGADIYCKGENGFIKPINTH